MANGMRLTLMLTAIDGMSKVVASAARNSIASMSTVQRNMANIGRDARNNMFESGAMAMGGAAALAYPLQQAANLETLRLSMDIFTRSSEAGAKAYGNVITLARETPLGLNEVAKATTMMMGYGQSVEGSAKAVKMLGDVVALSPQGDLGNAIVAYGQAAQEGKMLTRDVRQFINAGVPMVSILKEVLGKDANIMKLAEEGKLTFDVMSKALEVATSKGGMFADGMKQQAGTAGGQWMIFRDELDKLAATFGKALIPALKDLNAVITPAIKSLTSFLETNNFMAKAVMYAVSAITIMAAASFILNAAIWAGSFALQGFGGKLILAAFQMTSISAITGFLSFQFFRLRFAIFAAGGGLRGFVSVMRASVIPAIIGMGSTLLFATKAIWAFTTAIFNIPIVGWVLAIIAAVIALGVVLYKNWDAIKAFFTRMWNGFQEFLPKARQWGVDLIKSITDGIKSGAPMLFAAVDKVVTFARGFFPASPAKHGAFKDLHRIKIIEQVARSVRPNSLTQAIGGATAQGMNAIGGLRPSTPANSGGGVSVTYSPVITLGAGSSDGDKTSLMTILQQHKDEIARMVNEVVRSQQRKTFTYA